MEYTELDGLISELREMVEDESPEKGYWGRFWTLVKEIGAGFRGMHYPTREEHEQAWARYQELVTRGKARGEAERARQEQNKQDWEKRQFQSRRASEAIQAKAAGAEPASDFARSLSALIFFPMTIIAKIATEMVGITLPSELENIHQELLSCNEHMRKAWDAFKENKDVMFGRDKQAAYEQLRETQDKLQEAWARWKEAMNASHQQRRASYEKKHEDFVQRVEANIAKNEVSLEKAKAALQRQEEHLEELQEKMSSAWNDSFKERCSQWIAEGEEKIQSIKDSIERLEGLIAEDRAKLL